MTSRILLLIVGLLVASILVPASAAEPTDREKLFQAFDLLQKDYEKKGGLPGLGEKPGFVKIPERDTPLGKVKSIVKVAARKYDPKAETVGDYVSLTTYRWKPDEYFVLCFQSANPVTFSLFNVTKAADGKPRYDWLLPSDRMPESTAPIKPGKVYEFTKPLQMESHADNEAIQFVFSDASNKGAKKPPIAVFAPQMMQVASQLRADGARYQGLVVGAPEKMESRDFNEVAVILGSTTTSGVLDLTLLK